MKAISTDTKIFVLGTLLGATLSYFLWRLYFRDDAQAPFQPEVTDEHIEEALTAYTLALEKGEDQSLLNDLNTQFAGEYGLRVYQRKSDGKIVATDLSGKEVKVI